MTKERYYLQYHPFDGSWEVWERTPEGGHALRASFNEKSSSFDGIVEIVLSFLNAVAEVGEQDEAEERDITVAGPLRETLGRALYEEKAHILHESIFPWEWRNAAAQEMDRQCAEAVVAAYLQAQHRPITPLTQAEIEVRLTEFRAQHEAVDET